MRLRDSDIKRFWDKVNKDAPHGCWEWTAATLISGGYGAFRHRHVTLRAHRVSYYLANGELEEGKVIIHKCDNPKCVNPAHLGQGTQKENMSTVPNHGHTNLEFTNARMKLSKEAIIEILQGGKSDRYYGRKYKVDHKSIPRIRKAFTVVREKH